MSSNYNKTFEKTNSELTSNDFAEMKNQLIPCSEALERAMIDSPDYIDWFKACRNLQLSENVIRQNIDRLDRPHIVKTQTIPEDVLELQLSGFDWEDVQKYQVLPLRLIKKNNEIFSARLALQNVQYPLNTLEYLATIDGDLVDTIFQYQKVDDVFIEKRMNSANVNIISRYQKLSSEFIEKNFNMFKPSILVEFQQMSEELIEKHLKSFDINAIAKYQNLSYDFCVRHNINASMIIMYQTPSLEYVQNSVKFNENSKTILFNRVTAPKRFNLKPLINPEIELFIIGLYSTEELSKKEMDASFIARNIKTLDMINVLKTNTKLSIQDIQPMFNQLNSVCKCIVFMNQTNPDWKKRNIQAFKFWNTSDSEEIVRSMTDDQRTTFVKTFTSYITTNMKWSQFLRENQVPEWFIDTFSNYIDWVYVIRHQILTDGCIQRNLIHIDINYLIEYVNLSETFIIFNRDILIWELVCKHQIITENIIKQCHEFIDIVSLRKNTKLKQTTIDDLITTYNGINPTKSSSSSSSLFTTLKNLVN